MTFREFTKLISAGLPIAVLLSGLVCLLVLSDGGARQVAAQETLTAQQRRGKQIYLQGTSASGKEILAYLGDESMEVPGSTMACANCHGFDGRGKPEGGVVPSDLTWEALTKPYGLAHADGRKHPPYTERALELAIKKGTDPAGNKLQKIMPRYAMAPEDLADLIVYLERLGRDRDPGINDDRIVIGMTVPATGAVAELGQAIKAITVAYFAELNSQGGIYNRRVELKIVETGESPAATRANVVGLLKEQQVFAMTGAFIAGAEKEIVPLMAENEVPLIGPFTLFPQTGSPLNRQVFYVLAGLDGQARALVDFAASKPELKDSNLLVVYPRNNLNAGIVEAIRDESRKAGLHNPETVEYLNIQPDIAELVRKGKSSDRSVLFFLGSGDDLKALISQAAAGGWYPLVFLPSSSSGSALLDAPAGFDARIFLAFPTSPADQTAEGLKEFRQLAEKYKLPTHHLAAQLSAYSAAKILVEGLKRAGKDLSREKLIQALEGLYQYQTGLTPAITYGPNRRVGANGAHVITIDLKAKSFRPASGWIDVK